MFVSRKIWRALLSCYLRFEIRPFALLPTIYLKLLVRSYLHCLTSVGDCLVIKINQLCQMFFKW